METEKGLVYAAVVVLAVGVGVGIVVSAYTEEPAPEGDLRVTDTDVSLGEVTGETVTLGTVVRLTHHGGVTQNVSVAVRATRTDTGLLAAEETDDVGTVEGNGEVRVDVPVTVEREGDYRLDVVVYEGDRRVGSGSTRVSGVGSVEPGYASSNLRFHNFPFQPAVEFSVVSAGNEVGLRTVSYLTNEGDETENARLVVKARQTESGIVAAEESTDVTVEPGATATPAVRLNVPDGYDYYLDATLWSSDTVVATHRSAANLDPNKTVDTNTTVRDAGLEVSDFEKERGFRGEEDAGGNQTAEVPSEGQPGFGAVVALVALVAVALARREKK
jgi:PGF-CTERM protein